MSRYKAKDKSHVTPSLWPGEPPPPLANCVLVTSLSETRERESENEKNQGARKGLVLRFRGHASRLLPWLVTHRHHHHHHHHRRRLLEYKTLILSTVLGSSLHSSHCTTQFPSQRHPPEQLATMSYASIAAKNGEFGGPRPGYMSARLTHESRKRKRNQNTC